MGACISYPSRVTEENLTEPGTPPPEEEGDHHSSRDSYNSCKSAGSRTYGANGKVAFKASKKQKEEMGKLGKLEQGAKKGMGEVKQERRKSLGRSDSKKVSSSSAGAKRILALYQRLSQ